MMVVLYGVLCFKKYGVFHRAFMAAKDTNKPYMIITTNSGYYY